MASQSEVSFSIFSFSSIFEGAFKEIPAIELFLFIHWFYKIAKKRCSDPLLKHLPFLLRSGNSNLDDRITCLVWLTLQRQPCNTMLLNNLLEPKSYGLAMQRDSPYTTEFTVAILEV